MKDSKQYKCFIVFSYFFILTASPFTSKSQTADEKAIRQVIEKQTEGWNKGSVDEYMKGYWQSDSLVYIGKSGPKYGYKTALENYKKNYPDTTAMGKLALELLQMKKLSADYYFVIGKWSLQRSIGDLQGTSL